jgi:D-amino-acid dehydrogenase
MRTVILGGGIVGVSTAYFLAKRGDDVTVIERRPGVALETSFANAGLIAPGHSYSWASPSAPLILVKSLFSNKQPLKLRLTTDWRLYAWGWQFLQNCTAHRADINTSYKARLSCYSQSQLQLVTQQANLTYDRVSKGLLYLHRDQAALDSALTHTAILAQSGLRFKVLNRAETLIREPALQESKLQFAGSLFCQSDESGDAHLFTRALYERCLDLGVTFQFGTVVENIAASADAVDYVATSGGRVTADRFVVAAGSYSPGLVRSLGYRLPIYPVKGYSVTLPVLEHHRAPEVGGLDETNLIGWARFGDRLRFTATAEFAGFDTTHSPEKFVRTLRAARDLFPSGADYSQPKYWAGLRPMTPTGTPIIGRSHHHNLYFNTGHGHLGWTWSCGTAQIVADIMSGKTPEIDLTGLTLTSAQQAAEVQAVRA